MAWRGGCKIGLISRTTSAEISNVSITPRHNGSQCWTRRWGASHAHANTIPISESTPVTARTGAGQFCRDRKARMPCQSSTYPSMQRQKLEKHVLSENTTTLPRP